MKTRLTLFAAGLFSILVLAACLVGKPTQYPPQPSTRDIVARMCIPFADVTIVKPLRYAAVVKADAAGDAFFSKVPNFEGQVADLYVRAPGYKNLDVIGQSMPDGNLHLIGTCIPYVDPALQVKVVGADSGHADPMAWSMERLLAIRGAMWTARLNLPYGPRPGQDDNILAFDYYQFYSASDRQRMREAYGPNSPRGYTHAVTGPVIGTDCYHSLWPCHDPDQPGYMPYDGVPTQAQWDFYLDCMQELWDAGIAPVHFAHPDGWSFEDMAKLEALYMQPRAQRLLRIIVWTGWEPARYEWSNATWVNFFRRAHEIFPPTTALLVHTVCDTDAPTGGHDDDGVVFPSGQGNIYSWHNSVPYLNGWLVQNCGYYDGGSPVPSPTFLKNFMDQFNPAAGRASLIARFRSGVAGWPTYSRNGGPLKVYNAEVSSYANTWKNWPESEAIKLGAAAMEAGADGFLDGGR